MVGSLSWAYFRVNDRDTREGCLRIEAGHAAIGEVCSRKNLSKVLTTTLGSHRMPEDGFRPWEPTIDSCGHSLAAAALEDDVMNNNHIKFNAVLRLAPASGGAGVECARRSEVSQH
jgi:hypothetical protein